MLVKVLTCWGNSAHESNTTARMLSPDKPTLFGNLEKWAWWVVSRLPKRCVELADASVKLRPIIATGTHRTFWRATNMENMHARMHGRLEIRCLSRRPTLT